MKDTLKAVDVVTEEAHSGAYVCSPEDAGWMGEGVLGLKAHRVSGQSVQWQGSQSSAYQEQSQFRLNSNTVVNAESGSRTVSFVVMQTLQKPSQGVQSPVTQATAVLKATISAGQSVGIWELVSGTLSTSVTISGSILNILAPNPSDNEAVTAPTKYTYDGANYDAWEMGSSTLYNGAGGCPQSKLKNPAGKWTTLTNPWKYDPSRAAGSRWRYNPNSNNYLHEVIQER